MQEPKTEVPRHIKQRPGEASSHHIMLKFSVHLESLVLGSFYLGTRKEAIPTSTRKGMCWIYYKDQRSHRNEDKPGLLGPESEKSEIIGDEEASPDKLLTDLQ